LRRVVRDQDGFTLVELLVVILIIGILAEIALPSFLNQTSKANDAAAKFAVRSAETAIEIYHLDNGTYCTATPAALVAIDPSLANANQLTVSPCRRGNTARYTVSAASRSSLGTVYWATVDQGTVSRGCSTPGQAGCSPAGTW